MDMKMNNKETVYKNLMKIYGIGPRTASWICEELGVSKRTLYSNMRFAKKDQLKMMLGYLRRLQEPLNGKTPIQFRLKKFEHHHITNLIKAKSYKGMRHELSYPVRGQRTRTNAKTARRLNRSRTSI